MLCESLLTSYLNHRRPYLSLIILNYQTKSLIMEFHKTLYGTLLCLIYIYDLPSSLLTGTTRFANDTSP